jgi:hypothetical protein
MRSAVLTLTAILLLFAAACGDDDDSGDDGSAASTSPAAEETSAHAAATSPAATDAGTGPVTIASTQFRSAVTAEVGGSWSLELDTPDLLVLRHDQDDAGPLGYIGMAYPVAVYSYDGLEQQDVPEDLVAWVEAHPRLTVVDKQQVEVGGLAGVRFELASDEGNDWAFLEDSEGTLDIAYNGHFAFYILEAGDAQLAILVDTDQPARYSQFVPVAEPVIDSIQFES